MGLLRLNEGVCLIFSGVCLGCLVDKRCREGCERWNREDLEGIFGGALFRLIGVNFVVFFMFFLVVVGSVEVEVDLLSSSKLDVNDKQYCMKLEISLA